MPVPHVALLQSDPGTSQSLVVSLHKFFPSICEAHSLNDLKECIHQHHAEVVILDMALASIPDVTCFHHEFPGVGIVCNHRLADEEMWLEALNAGAADCCPSGDSRSIVMAALENMDPTHRLAA